MSYHIRHIKSKTVYTAYNKAGDKKAYQLDQETHEKYLRGLKEYPQIRSMPKELHKDTSTLSMRRNTPCEL
jgi:hypothetical protein